jgi:hypothetical protein
MPYQGHAYRDSSEDLDVVDTTKQSPSAFTIHACR